jgi:hypothetical protein
MRSLRLARIAAEVEVLRLRHSAQRTATRVALGLVAIVFLFGTLAFVHLAVWFWLRLRFERPTTGLLLAGADLVLALVCVLLASRSSPSRVELQALDVRRRAIESVGSTIAWSTLALQALRVVSRLGWRR